jgi:hypothetical protein
LTGARNLRDDLASDVGEILTLKSVLRSQKLATKADYPTSELSQNAERVSLSDFAK